MFWWYWLNRFSVSILIHQKFVNWEHQIFTDSLKLSGFIIFLTAEFDLLFCLSPTTCALGTATHEKGHSASKPSFICQLLHFVLAKTPYTADPKWTTRSWIKAIWNRISAVWSSSTCTCTGTSRISKNKLPVCGIILRFYNSINTTVEKELLMLSFMHLQMCFLPNFTHTQLHVLSN